MTKITTIEALAESLVGKKVNSSSIQEVANLNDFRKNKIVGNRETEKVKISVQSIFSNIQTKEAALVRWSSQTQFDGLFKSVSDRLAASLKQEIGKDKFSRIETIAVSIQEVDTSFLDEPSEMENYFVFEISYLVKQVQVPQTDKEVVESLKSKIGKIRYEQKKEISQ